jgi:uncharacterized protein (DUF486 family)
MREISLSLDGEAGPAAFRGSARRFRPIPAQRKTRLVPYLATIYKNVHWRGLGDPPSSVRLRPAPLSSSTGNCDMPVLPKTVLLLIASNVFMTFAWYAHLKDLKAKPWLVAVFASWGIALFEYLLQVPANRIGHEKYSVGQLKILQEVITLSVFVPFAVLYIKEPIKLDYLWAALCLCGAVYFVFRG